jgi:hypothetical protein
VLSVFRVPSERAQPKLRWVYCAALPFLGLLAPGHSGPDNRRPNASLYETSWIPKGTMGTPNGTRLQSARLGRRKGQGKIAKSTARKKDQEGKTKRSGPRGQEPQAKMSGPPTERGCKAQALEAARALRPWGSDGSKARGHGRSPCYRSSVFRRKGRSPS